MQDGKETLKETRRQLQFQKEKLKELKKKSKLHRRKERDCGNQLEGSEKDRHTARILKRQIAACNDRIPGLERTEKALSTFVKGRLGNYERIAAFFKEEFKVKVGKSTVGDYIKKVDFDGRRGRPPLLSTGGKEIEARDVLPLDEMDRVKGMLLAEGALSNPRTIAGDRKRLRAEVGAELKRVFKNLTSPRRYPSGRRRLQNR